MPVVRINYNKLQIPPSHPKIFNISLFIEQFYFLDFYTLWSLYYESWYSDEKNPLSELKTLKTLS